MVWGIDFWVTYRAKKTFVTNEVVGIGAFKYHFEQEFGLTAISSSCAQYMTELTLRENVSHIQVLVILLSNPTHPSKKIRIANSWESCTKLCNSKQTHLEQSFKLSREANRINQHKYGFFRVCAVHFGSLSKKKKFAGTKLF
jgi:hypothetical protein